MDTDILITHGPPHGYGDKVERTNWVNGKREKEYEYVGCQELLEAIRRVKPQVHIFGHIHEGYGIYEGRADLEGIKLINASVVNEDYRLAHAPITFELQAPRSA